MGTEFACCRDFAMKIHENLVSNLQAKSCFNNSSDAIYNFFTIGNCYHKNWEWGASLIPNYIKRKKGRPQMFDV